MKLQIVKGSTSQIVTVFIQDSTATDGSGLGSLDQTSSIVGGYVRTGAVGVALAVDENVTTEGTYEAPSAAGKVRIGTPANMTTGTYELHFHNDLFAAGSNSIFITLGGAADMAVLVIEIQLTTFDLNTDNLGTPVALDGGSATIAGMLTKMADDNGGADFNAGTDSLEKIQTSVAAGFPQNVNADVEPAGGIITTGTNTANDSDSTWANDGTYWQVAAATAAGGFGLNMHQVFTLGLTLKPSILRVNAKETLSGVVHVWLYDYDAAAWEQVSDNDTAISGNADNDFTYIINGRHQQASDGEVQVRYTSTSEETNKYLYLDLVVIQAVAISELTAAEIAQAVWEADLAVVHGAFQESAGHILHDTFAVVTTVATGDTATSFTLTAGQAANDCYNGMVIIIEDETDSHYEARRIVDYTSGRVVTVDRAFSFTPAAGDHVEIVNISYADVNVTHLAASAIQQASGYIKVSSGTGTGQLSLASGVIASNLYQILGTTVTETSGGYLTAAFKKLFDVASPVLTAAGVDQTGDSYGRIGAAGVGLTNVSLVSTGLASVTTWTVDITGTVSGNSTHTAANVYTAFGTGGNLTTCATATGFSTPTNVTDAHSTTDGLVSGLNDFDPSSDKVFLGDGAHGGASTIITFQRMIGSSTHADGTIDIDNTSGAAMNLQSSKVAGYALHIQSTGTGDSHALYAKSDGDSSIASGAFFDGAIGLTVTGLAAGLWAAGSSGTGALCQSSTGYPGLVCMSGLQVLPAGDHGISLLPSTNGHGLYAPGNGTGSGIYAVGGATGHGILGLGGATSGDGIHGEAQTLGDGMELAGAGGGYDLNADIQGALSGAVTTDGPSRTASKATGFATPTNVTDAHTATDAGIAAVKADTASLLTRITATLFSGITSLASWLGLIAGKTADAGTLAEIQATTAGAGYTNLTDSLQAIRDSGGGTVTDITAAALAKFCTEDTGETVGAPGSVAKISQGAAGGNVTVGDFTVAALAQLATEDTLETAIVSGSALDLVWAKVIETGTDARQALALIGASTAGKLTGADGTTVTICGMGVDTTRIVATVDEAWGNRTAVTLTPPS